MPLPIERLREVVAELASRPKHEKVRALVYELLVNGLGASSTELDFERMVPEVRGRIDALLGRTVFEFKSDLRREIRDVENKLPDYLAQREKETSSHFIGIATDGATFIPYELSSGKLCSLEIFVTSIDRPHELLAWLSSAVAVNTELQPSSEVVQRELGRKSLAWHISYQELISIWNEVGQRPDVRLKRDLWAQLIRRVYGSDIDENSLFLQHTYLTIIAKTMATKVLGVPVTDSGTLLSGRGFSEAGIFGIVESDFFDWLLDSAKGTDLVWRIYLQANRFKLEDVQTDVLKGLYESLIDTEQRHFLGEYYTPDWLASKICAEAIDKPLEQNVLDPACGSGTFLFHAVRRLLKATDEAGLSVADAINRACHQVIGVDVHPVSVQIARVTFLLALGQERLKQRPSSINIPVYIGDSLQWNTRGFLAERDVLIEVPGSQQLVEFPFEVARDPAIFDTIIRRMLELSQQDKSEDSINSAAGLKSWLEREYQLTEQTVNTLMSTYVTLHILDRKGKDHIWGFVARNLVRPIWLSQQEQRVDIVIGNPPWLAYRFMDQAMQIQFRDECQTRGLWMGQVAQQQDLSAYFFVRSIELYLKPSGRIAFIMPYATMTRRQYAGFRTGIYGVKKGKTQHVFASIRITQAWAFSDEVWPLFPVPSCVLFAENAADAGKTGRIPNTVLAASGELVRRDATVIESEKYLTWRETPWPTEREGRVKGGYADRFREGAIIIPRLLFTVQEVETGRLGINPIAPLVESRRTSQEKTPWKDIPALRECVEKEFLRPLYLGESIVPFRVLSPVLAVIPWFEANSDILNSTEAQTHGYAHLSSWLQKAEQIWVQHGSGKRALKEQLNYYGQLSAQFPIKSLRVVYSKAGTLPAACLLNDSQGIVDHTLYWIGVETQDEGLYLLAILNSETARKRVENLQARGQWGARHFDKAILSLPIPSFDPSAKLHSELAKASAHAQDIASTVDIDVGINFIKARRMIRSALNEDGIDKDINNLVGELFDGK
jgi:SAM-dependent methyltransferase